MTSIRSDCKLDPADRFIRGLLRALSQWGRLRPRGTGVRVPTAPAAAVASRPRRRRKRPARASWRRTGRSRPWKPAQPAEKFWIARRSRTGRRLGIAAFEFHQHGPEQFVVGRAGDESGLSAGAQEHRYVAFLGRPAEPLAESGVCVGEEHRLQYTSACNGICGCILKAEPHGPPANGACPQADGPARPA
jgi:hypothetical protein